MKKTLYRFAAVLAVLALAISGIGYAATTTADVKLTSNWRARATGTPEAGTLQWDIGANGVKEHTFTNGSGSGAINKIYVDTVSATTSYDLDAGTLTDPAGGAVTFARIAAVRIVPSTANTAALSVGGDFILSKYLTGWVDDAVTIPVHLLGSFEWVAPNATGVAVTATTGDVITVTVSGADTYTIIVLGS